MIMSTWKKKDDERFLLNHKYLQSLRLVTHGVTHDYNNIFTGLSGQIKFLEQQTSDIDGERRRDLLEDLLARGVKRTSVLFDFARYAQTVEPGVHSLDRIIDHTADALLVSSRVHSLAIERTASTVRVKCRFNELVLMLFYLGENAFEAQPQGGVVRIVVDLHNSAAGDAQVAIGIHDQGNGVTEAVCKRLFEPFVSTKQSEPFAGLGLYAARVIARRAGGNVFAANGQVGGAVFTVVLPVHETSLRDAQHSLAGDLHLSRQTCGRQREVFLIVEDDEGMREMLVVGLQRLGHVVFCAETCAEALVEYDLVHETVTVLLIDIGLTDMDGVACFQKLVGISDKAVVIFMSGDEPTEKMKSTNGIFLQKPFTIKQIEEALCHDQSGS